MLNIELQEMETKIKILMNECLEDEQISWADKLYVAFRNINDVRKDLDIKIDPRD